jgi:hypothetical protein
MQTATAEPVAGNQVTPHTHECPECKEQVSHMSDPVEDGEPEHCMACRELECGGEMPPCEDCFNAMF